MNYNIFKRTFVWSLGLLMILISLGCSNTIDNSNSTPVPDDATACDNGMAGIYPCNDYDLMGHLSLNQLSGGASGNDCWGWTDPTTAKEYALVCTSSGVSIVDISDPVNPLLMGTLPTATISTAWRDVKVYNNHAFVVADNAGNHGLQIFDLTRLRSVNNPPETFSVDAHYTGFGSAHNVVINETSGYAYIVGSSRGGTYAGGPLFINIQDPLNPVDEGGFAGYSHDAQALTYNGPDTDYTGSEILISSNENEIVIVDVTDKSNPQQIASINYANVGYTHQGWFTEDFRYFILGDELDEANFGMRTRTLVFDFSDLDNPQFHTQYLGASNAIDHNVYVKDNLLYQASYTAGLRILDLSNISSGTINEVGFFDTYPEHNNTAFQGAWNVYPFFESGNIIVSDIDRGLFILRKSGS